MKHLNQLGMIAAAATIFASGFVVGLGPWSKGANCGAEAAQRNATRAAGAAAALPPAGPSDAVLAMQAALRRPGSPSHDWFRLTAELEPNEAAALIPTAWNGSANGNAVIQSLLARWAAGDPEAAMAWSLRLSGRIEINVAVSVVLAAWAERDPSAAARRAETLADWPLRADATGKVAEVWSRSDFAAAKRWAESLEPEALRRSAERPLYVALAARDPQAAIDWMITRKAYIWAEPTLEQAFLGLARKDFAAAVSVFGRFPESANRSAFGASIAKAVALEEPQLAGEFALTLSPGWQKEYAVKSIVSEWTARDPAAAIAWVARLTEAQQKFAAPAAFERWAERAPAAACEAAATKLPAAVRAEVLSDLAANWMLRWPDAALARLGEMPAGPARAEFAAGVVWVLAKNDPLGAERLVAEFGDGEGRRRIVARFVPAVSAADPPLAAKYVDEIGDVVLRGWWKQAIAKYWLQRDRAAAEAWIATTDLPVEIKARLLAPKR